MEVHHVTAELDKEDLEAAQTPDFPTMISDVLDPPPFDHVLRLYELRKLAHEVFVEPDIFAPQQGWIPEQGLNLVGRDQ